MKNYLLVTNSVKDPDSYYSNQIMSALDKLGANCTGNILTGQDDQGNYLYASPDQIPDKTEFIIVLGGDGTFIHVAKDLIDLDLPLIGVNLGNLGYLTEIDVNNVEADFAKVISGDCHVERRMLLDGCILREGEMIKRDIALNDIVINRSQTMGIIDFEVHVNNTFLNRYSADGIIVSTPTGSTGYNLSAGGPIVHPTADIILATPICAHTLNSRSVVFSAEAMIDIIVKGRFSEREQQKVVSFDGSSEIVLENEDVIRSRRSKKSAKILRLNDISFIEHLGKKMR
ncbi:MAG: NAD(+)/NADH kinase [Parasporobacterium sp.]|nr:NAD(+)/NADH kinase [Parasporobacterium sp.]